MYLLLFPVLGGLLYSIGGYHLPFLVAAGLVVIDGAARLFMLKDISHEKGRPLQLFAFLRQRSILIIGLVVMLGAAIPAVMEPVLLLSPLLLMGLRRGK